jgi:hypothetical protein
MVHLYDVAPTMTNSSVCVRVCVCVCIDAKRILCPARGTIAGSKPSASLEDLVSSSSGRLSPRSIDSFAAGSISTSVAGTDRRHSSGARHNIGDGARNRSHGSGDGRRRSRWGDGRGKSGDNDNNGVAVVVDAAPAARHGNGGGGDNTGSRHNSGARHNLGRGARHRSRSGDGSYKGVISVPTAAGSSTVRRQAGYSTVELGAASESTVTVPKRSAALGEREQQTQSEAGYARVDLGTVPMQTDTIWEKSETR